MSRKTSQELNELCIKYKTDRLWSWSRYNKYKISPYEYYLTYLTDLKPDRENSIYGASGGFAHEILEKFYLKQIKYEDMAIELEDALVTLDISDLKFDRSNEEKNETIKVKYINNLKHFFNTHKVIETNVDLERFILIKIGNYYFQGYADLIRKDNDGNFIIQDWKTSSIYKGEKAIKEAGQLILYAEGLRQLGIPTEKIKICWDFLKYCNVTTQLANGKTNKREIERSKIGESLKSNAQMWLKKLGYQDDIEYYTNLLLDTNNIESLPKDVQDKYIFDDCYVYIPLSEEIIDDLKNNIIITLDEIIVKEKQFKITNDDSLFYDSQDSIEKQSYYFANLCGWSANLHKPYEQYIKQLKDKEENKNNIYSGVGEKTDCNSDENYDLAWIDML